MKKIITIGAIVLVAVAALGIAGFAYAQGQAPATPISPDSRGAPVQSWANDAVGSGNMPGRGAGNGRMGGFRAQSTDGSYGPLHEYIYDALAQALGLTPEELQTRVDAGDTMWAIAQEQGISAEQFSQIMTQARTEALNQAVANGALTQEQADFMLSRGAGGMWPEGYGPGSANCDGTGIRAGQNGSGRGMGRGMGGRWSNQAAP